MFGMDLYTSAQKHLQILGYHPLINVPNYLIPYKLMIPVPSIIMIILATIKLVREDNNILGVLTCIETIITTMQVLPKLACIVYYKKQFARLITDMDNKFWSKDIFDEDFRNELNKKQDSATLFPEIFCYIAFVSATLYAIRGVTFRVLNFVNYVPNYYFVQAVHLGFLYSEYTIVIGFNSLLIVLCVYTTGQYLMVGEKIRQACKTNDTKELHTIIAHHQFILQFTKEIRSVYSIFFLTEYFTSLVACCFQIYQLISLDLNIGMQIKCMTYVIDLLAQFALYCFPASDISDGIIHIYDVVTQTEWYENDEPFKKTLMMIIMRSKKDFQINAGGIAVINRSTYIQVFKTAMSFATFLQTFHI